MEAFLPAIDGRTIGLITVELGQITRWSNLGVRMAGAVKRFLAFHGLVLTASDRLPVAPLEVILAGISPTHDETHWAGAFEDGFMTVQAAWDPCV